MSKPRIIYLGETAWLVLRALAQNNGIGTVGWGARYREITPGYARIFSQSFHILISQELITRKGSNDQHTYRYTSRGVYAYMTGKVECLPWTHNRQGDEGEPFTSPVPEPLDHKWSRKWRTIK